MEQPTPQFPWRATRLILGIVVVAAMVATSWRWWPTITGWVQQTVNGRNVASSGEHDHDADEGNQESHDHGDHAHAHEEANSLELSAQARGNLGLLPQYVKPIELQTYQRTIAVPAVIVQRPGRTLIKVATPLTGVIKHVHAVTGEVVLPGTVLFEIQVTHEDLVQTQTDLLKTLGEIDVEKKEIRRLESVAESGAIAGKTLLERQYSKDKLEALLTAQRQALKLHGLSDRQIEEIVEKRRLLRELQIVTPSPEAHGNEEELRLTDREIHQVAHQDQKPIEQASSKLLVIEELNVQKGQSVMAGEQLCALADYSRLYIEGMAFEQDSAAISRSAQNKWDVTAVFDDEMSRRELTGLKMSRINNSVDSQSRSLSFYVDLPNNLVRDESNSEGQRFVSWQYRIGQRLQLLVPVEEWVDQLVVPVDAVAREGAESYVFQQNGDHFERVPVQVKYRDQRNVVIANDGSLYAGDVIALRSAHQMQMALKNKAGGGVDPHAGHNH